MVSDLRLPGEDGYWLLQQLRALESGRDVPVIAFSGNASDDERARSHAAGFAAHLVKPVDPEVLTRTLAATFSRDPGIV